MKLEEKIIKLRKEKGLSQEEFGETLNVSRQAVSKWENGEAKPDIDKIKLISEKYNVSYEYLLDDEVEENTRKEIETEKKIENTDEKEKVVEENIEEKTDEKKVDNIIEEKENEEKKEENIEQQKKAKGKGLKKILKILLILFTIYLIIVVYKIIMYLKINTVANSFDEKNFAVNQVLKTINIDDQTTEVRVNMYKYDDMIVLKSYWSLNDLNVDNTDENRPFSILYINSTTGEKYEMHWQNNHYNCKNLDENYVYDDLVNYPVRIVNSCVPDKALYILIFALDPTRIVLPSGTMYDYSSTSINVVTLNGVGLIDSVLGRDIYGNITLNRFTYNYEDWMYKDNYKNPMEEYKDLIVFEN